MLKRELKQQQHIREAFLLGFDGYFFFVEGLLVFASLFHSLLGIKLYVGISLLKQSKLAQIYLYVICNMYLYMFMFMFMYMYISFPAGLECSHYVGVLNIPAG